MLEEGEDVKKDLKEYLSKIAKESKRADCLSLVKIMEQESGYKACLHGKVVGFGVHHYVHDNGREGDAVVTGFLPRAQDIAIYIMSGLSACQKDLESLGKHKSAKVCLYVKKLSDVDEAVLRRIIRQSVRAIQKDFKCWEV